MRVVAIVQARMTSTRLPGKVLASVGQRPMLEQCVGQVAAARLVDAVVVATSVDGSDDAIAAWAAGRGVACSRGSLVDVLDRYRAAAVAHGADVVVRITGDCPLVDPNVVDLVIASYRAACPRADYASNTLERTYPRGLDTEVFGRAALECAAARARQPHEREHVTPFFYEHPADFRLVSVRSDRDWAHLRWTVDTAADLALVREILRRVAGEPVRWQEVLAIVQREPELAAINRAVEQKPLR